MNVASGRTLPRWMVGAAGVLAAVVMVLLSSTSASAQGGGPPPQRGGFNNARAQELEKRFRERLDSTVKHRLALTEEQHGRLREVASRTEQERRILRRDEMRIRTELRRELTAGDKVNEARVGELLDQVPVLERRRLEVSEQELRELAKFLSPVQRARYFALQEELRNNMIEFQRRRMEDEKNGKRGGDERGGRSKSDSAGYKRDTPRPPDDRQ
ncbi:MAG: hypothetical protein IBJ03_12185 [Gemmatimonadaceae bacterium]|nr:hypothetical protein [Gemmatimonadaceae bacterium]